MFPWLQCRSKRSAPSGRSSTWGTCWRPATSRAFGCGADRVLGSDLQTLGSVKKWNFSLALLSCQTSLEENRELIDGIAGFEDSVRKCEYRLTGDDDGSDPKETRLWASSSSSAVICHVVGITYQTIDHRLLAEMLGDPLGKNRSTRSAGWSAVGDGRRCWSCFLLQTRRWRCGWTNTAGRRTRTGRSSSTTRRRASSPKTLWRRSTLRVSPAFISGDLRRDEAEPSRFHVFRLPSEEVLLLFVLSAGVSSIMATSQWEKQLNKSKLSPKTDGFVWF